MKSGNTTTCNGDRASVPGPPTGVPSVRPATPPRVLRLPDVIKRTGLGKTSIYALQKTGSFPRSIPLTASAVGWIESEIDEWLAMKVAERAPLPTRHG
jgi:prophage regulatory protein